MKVRKKLPSGAEYEYNTTSDIICINNIEYLYNINKFLDITDDYNFKNRKLFLEYVLNELLDNDEFIDSSIKIQKVLMEWL